MGGHMYAGFYTNELRRNVVGACVSLKIVGVTEAFLMGHRYPDRTLLLAWRALQNHNERKFAFLLRVKYPLPREEATLDLPF